MNQRRRRGGRWSVLSVPTAVGLTVMSGVSGLAWAPSVQADTGQCTFPAKPFEGRPWSLKGVLLDQLWEKTRGRGVDVAVIDTGVDVKHPQLRDAVDTKLGRNFLPEDDVDDKAAGGPQEPVDRSKRGEKNGATDMVGHGTKVAGIIAARPGEGTGFVGIAPESTVIPIQQNDGKGSGNVRSLIKSINYAVDAGADVINISQDTAGAAVAGVGLKQAVDKALAKDVVVVASAGNDGLGGNVKRTYPASYPGVLAVASSDRNNERAPFSQSGDFVGVAAPGVDMVSTVPGGGHCADNGTSFSAPYVAGVAALLRAEHEDWEPHQIVAQIQQTAERSISGRDRHVGWGVVDPVRALSEDERAIDRPVAREGVDQAQPPEPAPLQLGETAAERNQRLGTYTVVGGGVLVGIIGGGALVYRDWRRRTRGSDGGAV